MKGILTYHSIDDSGSPISVTAGRFASHMQWLASSAVRVVPLAEVASIPADSDAVAITFDDAFKNFETLAAPVLLDYMFPATLFVVTSRVGQNNAWSGRRDTNVPHLSLLDWNELVRLASRGISLGAHGRTHCALDSVSASQAEDEIAGSAEDLELRTGTRPASFAYPYGLVTRHAAACVGRSYAWGCTTELRILGEREDAALLPRVDAYYLRSPGQLEAWGTSRFARRIRARALARGVRCRVELGCGRIARRASNDANAARGGDGAAA